MGVEFGFVYRGEVMVVCPDRHGANVLTLTATAAARRVLRAIAGCHPAFRLQLHAD